MPQKLLTDEEVVKVERKWIMVVKKVSMVIRFVHHKNCLAYKTSSARTRTYDCSRTYEEGKAELLQMVQ